MLDHIAHAVHRWQDGWDRYAVDFGAEWVSGGPGPGFAPGQVQFGNGARVELLMPHDTGANDFLERFLRSSGPGPHHLTFKVADIAAAIQQARSAGWDPIAIDLGDPDWMEAFLHPKQASGIVVQLAQTPVRRDWVSPAPDGYPTRRRARADRTGPIAPASLLHVAHAVADLPQARTLFEGLLGGRVVGTGGGQGLRWLDLSWGGPMSLRILASEGGPLQREVADWLDGRPGRVHHLRVVAEEPDALVGSRAARPDELASWIGPGSSRRRVIEPEANAGLRLVVDPHPAEGDGRRAGNRRPARGDAPRPGR